MTYDRISMLADVVGDRLRGNRIVGLLLPRASSRALPWKEMDASESWTPFETVYRAGRPDRSGRVLLACLGYEVDPERRIEAVRVLRVLRAEVLVIGFGCAALDPGYEAGSFVIVEDHVNCTGENPLRGPNDERLGPRYPDMSAPYDARWSHSLRKGAASMGLELRPVVYGRVGRSVAGGDPSAWAQARIDVVGEGLLDEAIAAVHCGLPVAAVGVVEKSWPAEGNNLCSSIPPRDGQHRSLAGIINQCLLCRGGMDDG